MSRKPNTQPTTQVVVPLTTSHPNIYIDCLDTGTLTPTLRLRQGDRQIAFAYDDIYKLNRCMEKAYDIYRKERPGTDYTSKYQEK